VFFGDLKTVRLLLQIAKANHEEILAVIVVDIQLLGHLDPLIVCCAQELGIELDPVEQRFVVVNAGDESLNPCVVCVASIVDIALSA
jgi:hypothetical protein